jgi:spectinomycin phosphotransferase
MRSLPDAFDESQVIACLAEGWGVEVASATYAPVGGGSYHWDVTAAGGRRLFVTVDDLDTKGWLGHDREAVFDGLRRAYGVAIALRRQAGLPFVIAAIPTTRGEVARRMDARHTVAAFPHVDGASGRFEHGTAVERGGVVTLLAELHRATPVALPLAERRVLDQPERRHLETALRELDRPWNGGPFSESARALLAGSAAQLQRALDAFDRMAGAVAGGDLVITHGEPHAGNVMRTAGGVVLIDWDTVGLAQPERDLWLVAGEDGELDAYTEATGRRVDPVAIALYRLRWRLDDLALFTIDLRAPHTRTADTEHAWRALSTTVEAILSGS